MNTNQRFLITSALPYANGPLHIGHLAGAYLNADIFARYQREKGNEVAFICGSDEHGAAITIRAKKDGTTPREIIDKYHSILKQSFQDFGISFDIYHRTSSPEHHHTAQEFFKVLDENGKFIQQESEQFYDAQEKQFLADRYIVGGCPKCDSDAYGDQCEKCGSTLSPTELIDPRSALSNSELKLKQTKHWYFPLNDYQDWLTEWINSDKNSTWKKNVLGQCKSWLNAGLQPRAMTRDLDWGVKVPVKNAEGKVLYVWMDAPIGYITATQVWAEKAGKNWKDFWQSDDSRLIHFVGKDNIVFHSIIFPSLLKAHGDYILPENVPANEFMNLEGDKISTSRNWAVWLHEYLEEIPNKEDELRYVLIANMPETKDSEFTWADYQARINNELVGNLGNFVNRVFVLTNKYYDGLVQPLSSTLAKEEETVIQQLKAFSGKIDEQIEAYRFRDALATLMDISRLGNQYLAEREPWKLNKTEPTIASDVLHIALQIAANLAIAMKPFMPKKAETLRKMFNLETMNWNTIGHFQLEAGHKIGTPELLFSKIEDELIEQQTEKLNQSKAKKESKMTQAEDLKPVKEDMDFTDFLKIDLRVGTILEAAKVEKTDKLLVFKVDMGFEVRTIISGVAKHYDPETCVGKQVCVVANLAPKKMRGIESQGMILFAEDPEGRLRFISPEEAMRNGSLIA